VLFIEKDAKDQKDIKDSKDTPKDFFNFHNTKDPEECKAICQLYNISYPSESFDIFHTKKKKTGYFIIFIEKHFFQLKTYKRKNEIFI